MDAIDGYRQNVLNQLLAAENKEEAIVVADISEQRNTDEYSGKQLLAEDVDDPIAQVLRNKLQDERQDDVDMEKVRENVTKDINMDIIESMIK